MKKFIKVTAIVLLCTFALFASLFAAFMAITKDARLDPAKLVGYGDHVIILDDVGNQITDASVENKKSSVAISNLNPHTIHAFIASEDRKFYSHNGLNYGRIVKAALKNIWSRTFKEGASTISQQLIKNTHLTSDKTITRKLNEIKLTKKLESKYSKDEILEMYLNTIYFGHNCYGLQSASQFYFDKKAENLDLCESATIVGLLASPNNYSPFKNPEKCLMRRNLVLKSMLDCGYIDNNSYNIATDSPLNATQHDSTGGFYDYISALFDELEDIDCDHYALKDGCTIKTYLNCSAQRCIDNLSYPCDNAAIITDVKTGGIIAYKTTIGGAKRQIGSTAKPLFVYAPAIEEKILSPFTKILDEKVNYNGYSPENYDKKYHGKVSVTDSIKYSYNVPAVKALEALTVNTCEKYLNAMDLTLDDDEKNLALALGGMKYGLTIKELADKYAVFARAGTFIPSKFIKEIIAKDGTIIYKNQIVGNPVFSQGTCSLINEMLIQTSKSGTAKKLKDLGFDVAAKTGTCGNSDGNTDAYAVSYTANNCFAVWLGDKANVRTKITGGNECCNFLKQILQGVYKERSAPSPDTASGTTTINIDREEYELNDKVVLADPICPKLNLMQVKVLSCNIPQQASNRFTAPTIASPTIKVENNRIIIELCHAKYYSYIVKRIKNGASVVIYDGIWKNTIGDTPSGGQYVYTVTPYYKDGDKTYLGEQVALPPIKIGQSGSIQIEIPDIANKKWYE